MPRDKRPIFVPTSEYLNRFVLKHKNAISNQSWIIASVEASTYNHISDKATSFKWLSRSGMLLPSLIDRQSPTYPCVFKPKKNVVNGASFYPIICFDSVHNTIESHMIDYYYCQEYVDGRSFYLCGYICKNGRFDYFWQENHLQQAAGKSMLLCSTVSPPISNSSEILSDLYKQGYHGPVMIEMIESKDQFYFIEINPRFWGPLQLALDSSSSILHLFALDQGFLTDRDLHSQDRSISGLYDFQKYYSWLGGYDESTSLKRYPLAQNLSHQALIALLQHNDVLAKHIKT
jgi:predicted ATP-grasp superfamily ATP-dependent carboligase